MGLLSWGILPSSWTFPWSYTCYSFRGRTGIEDIYWKLPSSVGTNIFIHHSQRSHMMNTDSGCSMCGGRKSKNMRTVWILPERNSLAAQTNTKAKKYKNFENSGEFQNWTKIRAIENIVTKNYSSYTKVANFEECITLSLILNPLTSTIRSLI